MVKPAQAAFAGVPPRLREAAALLGHRPWWVFWRVDLPLARRGVAAGLMLAGGRGLGEVGLSLMLGGNISRAHRNAVAGHLQPRDGRKPGLRQYTVTAAGGHCAAGLFRFTPLGSLTLNSVFFDNATIDAWIAEDAPLLDLTTHLLAMGGQQARMSLSVRGDSVAACTEEAARIVQHCGGQVQQCLASGTPVSAGDVLLRATGDAASLLRAWKVAQNLLEYACGVAGATARMVQAVQAAAPGVAVLTTRKHAPGLRRIALKATLSGGAFPHRLGVGETVLVFAQHRALVGDWDAVAGHLACTCSARAGREKMCGGGTLARRRSRRHWRRS